MTTARKKTSTSSTTDQPESATGETSQAILVRPLTEVEAPRTKGVGRPARLQMPDLPKMAMTETEQALFDYFLDSYKQQYPDMVPTDYLILHLAGLEYIKYLRVVAEELETHKVISMARQHPGVNMRALLDQLSVTRKARTARAPSQESDEARELRDFFMAMGRPKRER